MSIEPKNVAIIGSSGAIGSAFTELVSKKYLTAKIHAFSQRTIGQEFPRISYHTIDYRDEFSIETSASLAGSDIPLDLVIITNGLLHDNEIMPEKSLKELSAEKFQRLFEINTITPALIAKYFLPKLNREKPAFFAVLSARVGSISDNRLGGWYSYRASKAALNMFIKTAAIEIGRLNKQAIIVGLHPGSVDSNLSKPFQSNIPDGRLFSAKYSAQKLLEVLEKLSPNQSGKCFDWQGLEILP